MSQGCKATPANEHNYKTNAESNANRALTAQVVVNFFNLHAGNIKYICGPTALWTTQSVFCMGPTWLPYSVCHVKNIYVTGVSITEILGLSAARRVKC